MSFWAREAQYQSVLVRREFILVTNALSSALLLSQLVYWFRPGKAGKTKLTIHREGRYWLAKTKEEWFAETGLTPKMYRTAIAELTELEVVETRLWKFGGRPVTHYWLDVEKLEALVSFHDPEHVQLEPEGAPMASSTVPKGHPGLCPKGNLDSALEAPSYTQKLQTEKTAEITSTVQHAAPGDMTGVLTVGFGVEPLKGNEGMATTIIGATKFAGKTVADVLAKASVKDKVSPGDSLKMLWVKEYAGVYGKHEKLLTMKEVGQLGRIAKAVGPEKAKQAVSYAVRSWQKFAAKARDQKGLGSVPERPMIGFMLMHYDVALEMAESYLAQTASSTMPIGHSPKSEDELQLIAPETPKPQKQVASAEDALKAMQELGL